MTSAPKTRKRAIAAVLLAGAGVAFGFALVSRGPDPAFIPPMAKVENVGGKDLWVQTREVTIAEWNRCHEDGACTLKMRLPVGAKGDEDWPATGLSYADVSEYLSWINKKSRHQFRLPAAGEWQMLAKPVLPHEPDPIFTAPELTWASTYLTENLVDRRLRKSQSWDVTEEGVWDLNGNVWEWTQDCFKSVTGEGAAACPAFFVGGEHEAVIPYLVRDPARGGCAVGTPPPHLGMRLVSDKAA